MRWTRSWGVTVALGHRDVDLGGLRVRLVHGDVFCTNDVSHHRAHAMLRSRFVKAWVRSWSDRAAERVGQHATGTEGFRYAGSMTVDRLGNLYVGDVLNHRVLKLDRQGRVLLSLGRHGDLVGQFAKLKGVAVDRRGLIYVADAEFHVVQVFDNAGNVLFYFGQPTAPKGASALPAGICIDYENVEYFREYYGPDFEPEYLVIVVNQTSPDNKVAVYAFGRRTSHDYPPEDELATLDNQRLEMLWPLPVFPPDVHRARSSRRATRPR